MAFPHNYSLIVKADDLDVEKVERIVLEKIGTLTRSYPADDYVIVRVASESDLTNRLNAWMTEDTEPPFDDGSLLYWRPIEA